MSATKSKRSLRIGIVGARSIGVTHGRALAGLAAAGEPVAVAAYSGGSAESGAEMGWPEAAWVSHEGVLDDSSLDVVVLCSPTHLHGKQALRVASSGRHVVVEKPFALDPNEALGLVDLEERLGVVAAMISQRRHEFPYPQVKQLMSEGALGEPRLFATDVPWFRDADYFADAPWRASAGCGGGSLINQGVHNLDLLQWFAGPVRSITAQVTSQMGLADVDDTVAATFGFSSGALGIMTTSTATPPGFDATLTIYTDKGRVVLGQGEILSWEIAGARAPVGEKGPGSGAKNPSDIGVRGHESAWREILRAISTRTPALVGAKEGYKVAALTHGIYEAAREGRTVHLPPGP